MNNCLKDKNEAMIQLKTQMNDLNAKFKEQSAAFTITLANRDKRIDELTSELKKVKHNFYS
jgi:hypothetical protein